MSDALAAALRTHFGFASFRPGQAEAIASLLAGRHTLAVMPTGAGKSLIYQLTALCLPGTTLVLSPLIALMKDQVDSLVRRGIAATYINSTLAAVEQERRLQAVAAGAYRLVYVAPERLRSAPFLAALRGLAVSLVAVDEAHCISQWGHDFRPDYLHIAAARSLLGEPLTAALTATATPDVQDDIVRRLGLERAERIITGFNRSNLGFQVRYTPELPAKLEALRDLLRQHATTQGGCIVYVGTRSDAEEVAEFVRSVAGLEAEHYHGGMEPAVRARVEDAFLAGDLPVVVATNAFGMGVDRPDVRLVAHFDLPGTLEAYYQEAGRAGRDGEPSRAVLLYAPQDRALQEWFIRNDTPGIDGLRAIHGALCASGRSRLWTTLADLSRATGLPEVAVRVGLAQLEGAGCVVRLGDHGARMLISVAAWDEAALQREAEATEERRRLRLGQLAKMVAYAEASTCRRRMLLDHFGDRGPAEARYCCDNCAARRVPRPKVPARPLEQVPQAERLALAILDAARRLRWGVGRHRLAQILKGSRSRAMARYGYDRSPYFGRLAVFKIREIEGLIGQLVRHGDLKVVGGEQPVLRLTPQGEQALARRSAMALRLPRAVSEQAVAIKQAELQAGGTVALTAKMFAQGLSPAEIAAARNLCEGTIWTHLARLIGEGQVALDAVVASATADQVRAAIAQVGSVAALAPIKACLPEGISYGEIRCVVEAVKRETGCAQPGPEPEAGRSEAAGDSVASFLARAHPRPLAGPWQAGWALGVHSRFAGAEWGRTRLGELAYRLKYLGDTRALAPLVEQAHALCQAHPELAAVDALVPVPASTPRPQQPVQALARALGARLGRPVWPVLAKVRPTRPQKEMRTLAQKRANVAGAFAVRGDVRGKALLVIDDLYDSGETLREVARVLRAGGAARLCVLTLTRTIHADG